MSTKEKTQWFGDFDQQVGDAGEIQYVGRARIVVLEEVGPMMDSDCPNQHIKSDSREVEE